MSNCLFPEIETFELMKVRVDLSDTSKVICLPIREFEYRGNKYTITACANFTFPLEVFYSLQVRHLKESQSNVQHSFDKDFRALKKMMRREPIDPEQYEHIKHKLHRKLVEKKLEMYTKENSEKTGSLTSPSVDTTREALDDSSKMLQHKVVEENVSSKTDKKSMVPVSDSNNFDKQMLDILQGYCQQIVKALQQCGRRPPTSSHYIPKLVNEFVSAYNNGELDIRKQWLDYICQSDQTGSLPDIADKQLEHAVSELQWITRNIASMNELINDDDDDDDDDDDNDAYFGHILGIYSRRTVHGNYKG